MDTETSPEEIPEVFCPFSSDGRCPGGCPSLRERACVLGEED